MFHPVQLAAAALSIPLLTACGGGHGGPPAELSATTSHMVLAAAGTARMITVTNQGPDHTEALQARATGLPTGSRLRSTCPPQLNPGSSCLVLITPGDRPSAAPGDPQPVPGTVTIGGSNTNALDVRISVLTYGSVHQGGHVFALDDSVPLTDSVGGKVLATVDAPGAHWGPVTTAVPGIQGDSTAAQGACDGAVDGRCNTRRILAQHPSGGRDFAAAHCADSRHAGHADWYLPAVCELSYDDGVSHLLCGTQAAPRVPDNVRSRLHDTGLNGLFNFVYWSSTQSAANPAGDAHLAVFGRTFFTSAMGKQTAMSPSKCARAITP